MKKIILALFFCLSLSLYSQNEIIGGVSGLALHKKNVKSPVLPSDTLSYRMMNYHLIDFSQSGSFFKKLSVSLNQPSVFFVSNKFGGVQKKIYGKIGSSVISSIGIDDFSDSLRINSANVGSKILTFTKNDNNNKINPIVFLNKRTDQTLLIPEVLVFNHNLSTIDKQKVETYLSIKYGITINDISEKNYVSSGNDILWDSKKNKNYNFRITGIGRDDLFNLYQKQSKNAEDNNVAISLGNVQPTNYNNSSIIEHGSFLLWGDNNQSLTFKQADLISAHPKRDMERMWKAQIRNTGSAPIKTHVYLNLSGILPTDNVKLRVFDNDSDYQSDLSTDKLGERISDSLFVFKDINWDGNHDGTDYFTFNLSDTQSDLPIQITSTCTELNEGLVKITLPENIVSYHYSLKSLTTNQMIVNNYSGSSNLIVLNNLSPDNYEIIISRPGYPDIIRTFNLEGIVNQNIDDSYLWSGVPIELDLNTNSFQYTLTSPSGQMTQFAPYYLNGTGVYQLKIKNKLNCEITKTLSVLSQSEYDAQQNNSLFKNITVSPNPSHDGNLTIKVELKTARPITVKIFNSLGVLIKQGQYNSAINFNIPMNIPAVVGYYNIKIFIPEEGNGVNFLIN